MFILPTTVKTTNSKTSSSAMMLFSSIIFTFIQLILYLLKSILILFQPNLQFNLLNTFTNQACFYNVIVKQIFLKDISIY